MTFIFYNSYRTRCVKVSDAASASTITTVTAALDCLWERSAAAVGSVCLSPSLILGPQGAANASLIKDADTLYFAVASTAVFPPI